MRTIKLFHLAFLLAFAFSPSQGQGLKDEIAANPDLAGGMYYAYEPCPVPSTPAPVGYEPFYISHYGRHGSRWLLQEDDYGEVLEVFRSAAREGLLTPLGEDVAARIGIICADALDRAGSLTSLGEEQHRRIAERMYDAYPGIFPEGYSVRARSTTIVRCVMSMAAFCERLKELEPGLEVVREADRRTTRYLEFFYPSVNTLSGDYLAFLSEGEWIGTAERLLQEGLDTGRLMSELFTGSPSAIDGAELKFVRNLFLLAVSLQNTGLELSLYDLFTDDDLYLMNVYDTYRYYVMRGPSPLNGGYPQYYARALLEDMISCADGAVRGEGPAADLRFGHDLNIMALVPLLRLDGLDISLTDPFEIAREWPVHRISPMAGNLQMVFYRGPGGPDDVLVGFLLNEREATIPLHSENPPYYRWKDVEYFYREIIDSFKEPRIVE